MSIFPVASCSQQVKLSYYTISNVLKYTYTELNLCAFQGSAYREGSVKPDEILLSVDGRSCRDMSLNELKSLVCVFVCVCV